MFAFNRTIQQIMSHTHTHTHRVDLDLISLQKEYRTVYPLHQLFEISLLLGSAALVKSNKNHWGQSQGCKGWQFMISQSTVASVTYIKFSLCGQALSYSW
jgi:hypothetical protein